MAAALVLGCSDDGSKTTAPQLSGAVVGATAAGGVSASKDDNHGNHTGQRLDIVLLTGDQEAPIPRVTPASGQLTLQLSDDGLTMSYILEVANISNVTQAHIHIGAKGATGPIAVWLFPGPKARNAGPNGAGPLERLLVEGKFTAADFIGVTGLPAGSTMADFVNVINNGGAYGNVHTNDGVAPADTGPGDFPGGEIRGQLNGHGKH